MNHRKHITIRPRRNSALERIHDERRKEFPDLVHKWADAEEAGWAETFASMKKQSEEKE